MRDYVQANTDGRLHDALEPSVPPLNRGFLYGDAIYEVWRTYNRTIFSFHEHWARLSRSAGALEMDTGLTTSSLLAEIQRTAAAFRKTTGYEGELYIRLQVTRGGGPIGLDSTLADKPSWVILVQRLRRFVPREGRRALYLSVARKLHRNPSGALNPAWKTGNYLNNLLCLQEARNRGADEVVILNAIGGVAEAAVCNIFFVRQGELITPPLEAGILEGITRGLIMRDIVSRAQVRVHERPVRPDEFSRFSECFLSSSTRDIAEVERIDNHTFSIGPDTITMRLKTAFEDYASQYADDHSELRT